MLWCALSTPPILRRITPKKSVSDLTLVKKANLSRGDSKQSERTLVEGRPSKDLKYSTDFDVLLIDSPPPPPLPPKDLRLNSLSHTLSSHNQNPDEKPRGRSEERPREKPLPTPEEDPQPEDSEPLYPWYHRRIHRADESTRYTPSQPSLLPRSHFALSTPGSSNASLNLFGGLVNDRAKNDVYTISVQDQSASRLYTIGDIPSPRFGHGSAFAGSVVVVWGGDTASATSNQIRARTKYDNGLHFLNLVSREWTRVTVDGPAPAGRVGHSVVMIGPKIYIFGGEANGEFFNDLWCFDLSTLISKPVWEQIELPKNATERPSKRSGHTCVAYKDQLIVFGGTDGHYHYNETWAFDTATKTWSELVCTGYIPSPREAHAAALVDDVMYVFGGRSMNDANIGELGAFKITTSRWFMFQNMGPEPSPRSGHGMVAVGTKVYVLGGICEDDLSANGQESNFMHILETDQIKYPTTKFSPPQTQTLVP